MTRCLGLLCAAIAFVALVALPGCVHRHHARHAPPRGAVAVVVHEPGPPPHAPAHGHRHRHPRHGVELVFDSALGVYAVVGWEDHFFHRDHYYRQVDGIWQVSVRVDGGWSVARHAKLPKRLVKRAHHRHNRKKHHGHPAKHGY